jgi:DNA repair photolyase
MKAVTLKEIKQELNTLSTQEIQDIVLRLSRFKKENKELLTYLLFESHNEDAYIESVKNYIDNEFELINTASYFYIKKSIRKILRNIKKFARYSLKKETEVALLLYFCQKLNQFTPSIKYNTTLTNIYNRQLQMAKKTISTLHEDLQHDYNLVLEDL